MVQGLAQIRCFLLTGPYCKQPTRVAKTAVLSYQHGDPLGNRAAVGVALEPKRFSLTGLLTSQTLPNRVGSDVLSPIFLAQGALHRGLEYRFSHNRLLPER